MHKKLKFAGLFPLAFALLWAVQIEARRGSDGGGDNVERVDKVNDRLARDTAKADERAARDLQRYEADKAKILSEASKDPQKANEELAKLEADRQKDLADAAEEAAKIAEDYAEELAKAVEDDSRDTDHEYGSSSEMRDLAEDERPEYDDRGFPVKRGEITSLDLDDAAVGRLQALGFGVIAKDDLPALSARIVRLSAPEGRAAGEAIELARRSEPAATFDYVHYYAMQISTEGAASGKAAGSLSRKKDRLTIGMIDTAVVSHSALKGVSIKSRSFGSGKGGVPVQHGTAVASLLASEGSSSLYVADIFRGAANRPYTSADALVQALEWMVANNVPVLNLSLSGPRNAILDKLVDRAVGNGTVIVAAAGNGGPTAPPAYPAALRTVIAVTAVDSRHRVYRYANQGSYITVAARGVGISAANSGGGLASFSGTSFAAPHVSAWMARCRKGNKAVVCAKKIRKSARDLGAPGYDKVYGHGLIE